MQIDVDFTWWRERNPKDYKEIMPELRRANLSLADKVHGKVPRIVAKRVCLEPYKPLEQFPDLFARFSKAQSQEDVIKFVRKFGPLTAEGLDGPGDDLVVCLQMAECMADADGPLHLNLGLPVCNLDAHLVSDRDGIRLKIGPPNLLFALWFQFAQAVSKGQANRCRQCKELFATGRNTNRRKGAEFCSIECKTKYHSLKRSL